MEATQALKCTCEVQKLQLDDKSIGHLNGKIQITKTDYWLGELDSILRSSIQRGQK